MKHSEPYITALLRHQDTKAIALLYDQYAPTLYGIVLRIVQTPETAEDVIQEAFVKAWQNSRHYNQEKGTLFTWLLNIARNTAIDKTRLAGVRQRNQTQPIDEALCNTAGLSSSFTIEHIGLENMVNELDEKHRIIIDMIYFQGYTHTEVTEQLNIPLGTVKTRLRIALRELRKFFVEQKVVGWLWGILYWFTY